jgi:hypothetical protein
MSESFPRPVTDDELILENALMAVMTAYDDAGDHEKEWVREAAIKLISEAYNRGVRDEELMVHHTLATLKRGRS